LGRSKCLPLIANETAEFTELSSRILSLDNWTLALSEEGKCSTGLLNLASRVALTTLLAHLTVDNLNRHAGNMVPSIILVESETLG
jgi:hypothetical protein